MFAPRRGRKEIAGQLADFTGVLQVDGCAAYKALAKDALTQGRIELAFCLAQPR